MDFETLSTEQQCPQSAGLDSLSALEAARLMNRMDLAANGAVERALPQIADAVERIAARLRKGGRLIYCGAGTSGRLGVLDASECPPTFGVSPDMVIGVIAGGDGALRTAVEGAEDSAELGAMDMRRVAVSEKDAVVAISASGTAAYCIGALDEARARGAFTAAMACNPNPEIAQHAETAILLDTGAEVIAGSTRLKAGTATKMALNMLSTLSMVRMGKVYGNLMVDMTPSNVKLRDRAVRMVQRALEIGSREEALALLTCAGGSVKAAIVTKKAGVDFERANAALASRDGFVREAIEECAGDGQ